jgi:hypothetical protein
MSLARASDRATEMAIRLSLSASAARLLRLFMTETCLLGVSGAAALLSAPAVLRVFA